jgi:hypothetical protein
VAQIANALFALSGRIPGQDLPPGMQLTRAGSDARAARGTTKKARS